MLRRFFRWLGEVGGGFSAGFLAYATSFGALGLAIAGPFSAEVTCWPQQSVLYVFETTCENAVADSAWWATVELARFAVAMPAIALYFLYEAIQETTAASLLLGSFVWTFCALVVLMVWAGFRHWRVRYPVVAWVLLAVFSGQAIMAAVPVELGTAVAGTCTRDRDWSYFPPGSFRGYPAMPDPFMSGWFSHHLAVMQEPPLWCGASQDTETYRFLWLRSFHEPVAVRITRRGNQFHLEAVVLDGKGGYEPGRISKRVTKELSLSQWQRVVAALDEVQFWRMRTTSSDMIGIDGAEWVIEGRRAGRYHVAARHSGGALWPVGNRSSRFSAP